MVIDGFAVTEGTLVEPVITGPNKAALEAARARDKQLEDLLRAKGSSDSSYGGGSYYISVARATPTPQPAAEDSRVCRGCGFDCMFRVNGGWECRRCGGTQPQFTGLVVREATGWELGCAAVSDADLKKKSD